MELGRRRRNVSPIHRQLPEYRGRRNHGSVSQFSEKFTDDGVPRDDGAALSRAPSRPEGNWQPVFALRSDGQSLSALVTRRDFRGDKLSQRNHLEKNFSTRERNSEV